jgi:16S rRNA (guanine527-N7)-methyltransferase
VEPLTADFERAFRVLESGFLELQRAVTPDQLDSLAGLAARVARWSTAINLTGHRGVDAIATRLVLEAVALEGVLPSDIDSLADIGSGAGFPGIPIAILRAGCRVTSIESRQKRVHFQRAAIREIGIQGVRVVLGRAEQLSASPHAAAIAQAVSPVTAAPLLARWTRPGGYLIFLGGEQAPAPPPGMIFEEVVHYRAPLGGPSRTLAVARKSADSS